MKFRAERGRLGVVVWVNARVAFDDVRCAREVAKLAPIASGETRLDLALERDDQLAAVVVILEHGTNFSSATAGAGGCDDLKDSAATVGGLIGLAGGYVERVAR